MNVTSGLILIFTAGYLPVGAFAQATFALQNHDLAAGVDAPVFDWNGDLLAGPSWRVELYGGAEVDSLSPVWNTALNRREIIPFSQPGYFWSWEGSLSVLSAPGGGWAWLQVRAWDVQLGATYQDAVARGLGGYGASALFYARGGNGLDPFALPAPLVGLQSFSVLRIVPEPSSWLLLAIGIGGLACRVRRHR